MDKISSQRMFAGYLSGAREVMNHKNILNKINVFPVPDGDTGSNLFSTMNSILRDAKYDDSVKNTLDSIADSALKGARGNSGIIFAQYLYGLSLETMHEMSLSTQNFVAANKKAVSYAYGAITNPVEGTIITVIKEWAEALHQLQQQSVGFVDLLGKAYVELEKSVRQTTQQLKVLKHNGVVDSGAKAFAFFIKGFLDFIRSGKEEIALEELQGIEDDPVLSSPEHLHMELSHRYCTEAMLEGEAIDFDSLRQQSSSFGDSLILAGGHKKARLHIHTDQPSKFFDTIALFGKITYQKIDDMKLQMEVAENRKYDIALVTDSIADLPQSFIDEEQIHVMPLNLLLDDINYLDRLSIRNEKVLDYIDQHPKLPTSSQPDYKSVENLFSFLSTYYKAIVVVTVSSKLSGTHNVFTKLASDMKDKLPPVRIIDSRLNSGAQGLVVIKCAQYIAEGNSLDEIEKKAEQDIAHAKILVNVKNIDNMIKAGRLSTRGGKIAKALHLKPIVSLDAEGKGTLGGIAFSFKQSKRKAVQVIKKTMKSKKIESYSVVHAQNLEEAQGLAQELEILIGKKPAFIEEISSITATSAGRGALAVSFIAS
jgi:uncharacterized protein